MKPSYNTLFFSLSRTTMRPSLSSSSFSSRAAFVRGLDHHPRCRRRRRHHDGHRHSPMTPLEADPSSSSSSSSTTTTTMPMALLRGDDETTNADAIAKKVHERAMERFIGRLGGEGPNDDDDDEGGRHPRRRTLFMP